ncbi:MAG: translation initiation factor IF-2 subunit beta [Candidatus Helarchaeota archaeon]|nr:translation initiation factor IF-2 subunit beta [Candidatus Helarchaeota archaeon]
MDDKSYDALLQRAMSKIPKKVFEHSRFKIPMLRIFIEGHKTSILNFKEIADLLNRNPQHIMKFFLRELATRGNYEGARATFIGKFGQLTLKSLMKRYTEKFVLCQFCKKPETRMIKDGKFLYLQCNSCGAKESIKHI